MGTTTNFKARLIIFTFFKVLPPTIMTKAAIEAGIHELQEKQKNDPDRYLVPCGDEEP